MVHYCLNGNYEKVKLYINLGYDVNIKDKENHQTLLEYATIKGHYRIVKLLIDHGANPNIYNKGSENAYLSAKRQGFTKIADLLRPLTTMTEKPKINSLSTNNSEKICQSAVIASGQNQGYAIGYCRNTPYSKSKWTCILKYTSSGQSIDYGIGACSNY